MRQRWSPRTREIAIRAIELYVKWLNEGTEETPPYTVGDFLPPAIRKVYIVPDPAPGRVPHFKHLAITGKDGFAFEGPRVDNFEIGCECGTAQLVVISERGEVNAIAHVADGMDVIYRKGD